MRALIVGGGAREHAIAWKLRQSPLVNELYVAPGNAGTSAIATNLPIADTDLDGLAQAARHHGVDLTVVGPEAPLAEGIVDHFQAAGLSIFGPTQAAARIESSKVFAKELMAKYFVPTGSAEVFDSYEEAERYVRMHSSPLVVKADGLAAGKGVTVAGTEEEAIKALRECMVERVFGPSGDPRSGGRAPSRERGQRVRVRGRRDSFPDGRSLRLQARLRRRPRPQHRRHGSVQPAGVLELRS